MRFKYSYNNDIENKLKIMKYQTRNYEIWIGSHHLGQGYNSSNEPQLVGKIVAPDFKVACLLYELRSKLKRIEDMIEKDVYIDHQSCRWFYDFEHNTNSWTGRYYESRSEALKSFV